MVYGGRGEVSRNGPTPSWLEEEEEEEGGMQGVVGLAKVLGAEGAIKTLISVVLPQS